MGTSSLSAMLQAAIFGAPTLFSGAGHFNSSIPPFVGNLPNMGAPPNAAPSMSVSADGTPIPSLSGMVSNPVSTVGQALGLSSNLPMPPPVPPAGAGMAQANPNGPQYGPTSAQGHKPPAWEAWRNNIANFESKGGAQAGNGGGALQFTPGNVEAFRKANPEFSNVPVTDPTFQRVAYDWLQQQNVAADPAAATDPGQNYAAWNLGPANAKALGANPNAPAWNTLMQSSGGREAIAGNDGMFKGDPTGAQYLAKARAIALSGSPTGQPTQTASAATGQPGQPADPDMPAMPALSPQSPQNPQSNPMQTMLGEMTSADNILGNPSALANSIQPTTSQKIAAVASGFANPMLPVGSQLAAGAGALSGLTQNYQKLGISAGQAAASERLRAAQMAMMAPYYQARTENTDARTTGQAVANTESQKDYLEFTDRAGAALDQNQTIGQILTGIKAQPNAVGPGLLQRGARLLGSYGISVAGVTPTGIQLTKQGVEELKNQSVQLMRGMGLRNQREFDQFLSGAESSMEFTPQTLSTFLTIKQNENNAMLRLQQDLQSNPQLLARVRSADPRINPYGSFQGFENAYVANYMKNTYGQNPDTNNPGSPITANPNGSFSPKHIATIHTNFGPVTVTQG